MLHPSSPHAPSHVMSPSGVLVVPASCRPARLAACSPSYRSIQQLPTHHRRNCRAECSSQSTDGTLQYSEASMADLQTQLDLAIRNEDYTLAAQLRDRLTCVP